MKKTITIILVLSLCLLCSCSPKTEDTTDTTPTTEPTPVYTYFEDAGGVIPKPDSVNDTVTFKKDTEDEDGAIMHVYTYPYSTTDDVEKIRTDYLNVVKENKDLSVNNIYSINSAATGIWAVKKNGVELCWIVSSPGTLAVKFIIEETTTAE